MTQAIKATPPETAAALIELYFEKGWMDGLSVIPYSEASVKTMLNIGLAKASLGCNLTGIILKLTGEFLMER